MRAATRGTSRLGAGTGSNAPPPRSSTWSFFNRPALRWSLPKIWEMEKWLLRLGNAAFLILVALAVVGWPARLRDSWGLRLSAASAIVLGSSIMQAFVEYGENPRYSVTVQPLVVLVVLVVIYRYIDRPDSAKSEAD